MLRCMGANRVTAPAETPPDWDKLRELSIRAEELHARGEMTVHAYELLLDEAETATNGHPEFVEALTHYRPAAP